MFNVGYICALSIASHSCNNDIAIKTTIPVRLYPGSLSAWSLRTVFLKPVEIEALMRLV